MNGQIIIKNKEHESSKGHDSSDSEMSESGDEIKVQSSRRPEDNSRSSLTTPSPELQDGEEPRLEALRLEELRSKPRRDSRVLVSKSGASLNGSRSGDTGSAVRRRTSLRQQQTSPLQGYWKVTASDNWDAFLKEAGVGAVMRKISRELTTYEKIDFDGVKWKVVMLSALKNFETTFSLNEEFEEDNFDGKKVKAIAYLDKQGDVLTIKQTALEPDGLELTIVREMAPDDHMMATVTITSESSFGVMAKRYFERVVEEG
ncbi:fatty acid-binding protein-like isoform X2 [Littorina saxatilis]|uniref:Uncharacterized protein n=1 Tax=Littorina saxatilis TaxID=31220 RepID=A0AAN9FYK5_9CAEN